MLVDVESRQPQRQLVLQLRGEPLLHHVVAALEEENIFILYTNILSLNSKLNIFIILKIFFIEQLKIFLYYVLDIFTCT